MTSTHAMDATATTQPQERRTRPRSRPSDGDGGLPTLAQALGWFSVALGVAELAAPRGLEWLIGLPDRRHRRQLLRAFGVRELTSGAGILASGGRSGWLWSRVFGDAMDLSALGHALTLRDVNTGRLTAATAAVAGVTALDVFCSERTSRRGGGAVRHRKVITVNRSVEEVYRFWRDLRNLPRFMRHLESVEVSDDRRSHWRVAAPGGTTVEWDAEIVDDEPNRRIGWRTLPGATVPNRGVVEFSRAPGDRGTEIVVELEYEPPAGAAGAAVAKLFGKEAGQQVETNLRRLKQILETGDVPTAAGPSARRRPSMLGQGETA